ncbi:hypothetical protein [Achromobacter insuavis]|uniref:hypothetical protein n=1 Tax=Achromobacter insuavis TaxID=1287735 RepID=UPI001EE9E1EB|nr:hypothetical protein [Achromobacter insuavis]
MTLARNLLSIAQCVGCGCTDNEACCDTKGTDLCYWLRVDRTLGKGVCNWCEEYVQDWDAGDYDKRTRIGPTDV